MTESYRHECTSLDGNRIIRVGLTEAHGIAKEMTRFPPPGVVYSFLEPLPSRFRLIRSPIKGYLGRYESEQHDLIEAILSPVLTESRWICSAGDFQTTAAFNLLGFPLPIWARSRYITNLMLRENFKRLIFRSNAGLETLREYGRIRDERLFKKVSVVYPAVGEAPERTADRSSEEINLMFSGDFFRKGGVNVIDAFERAQRIYPHIKLRLCCDENTDFNTKNTYLKNEYIDKIKNNISITLGRVPREELMNYILPNTDIYIMPSYAESFGYALLEAMAFGIPIIATAHFAIPEIVEHEVNGYLIETDQFGCEMLFRGYVVTDIPSDFRNYLTDMVFYYMCKLIDSFELREAMGVAGREIARAKFSFERRNSAMIEIYREALR